MPVWSKVLLSSLLLLPALLVSPWEIRPDFLHDLWAPLSSARWYSDRWMTSNQNFANARA